MDTERAEHDSGDYSEMSVNVATHLKSFNPWNAARLDVHRQRPRTACRCCVSEPARPVYFQFLDRGTGTERDRDHNFRRGPLHQGGVHYPLLAGQRWLPRGPLRARGLVRLDFSLLLDRRHLRRWR